MLIDFITLRWLFLKTRSFPWELLTAKQFHVIIWMMWRWVTPCIWFFTSGCFRFPGAVFLFFYFCAKILDNIQSLCYDKIRSYEPVCRNWQTRQTQNLLSARACGFESHHRHDSKTRINTRNTVFMRVFFLVCTVFIRNFSLMIWIPQ